MYLPSICHCASGQAHQPGCMVQCRMPPQTFCSSKASGLYPARWMITSSSRFSASFCQNTTGDTRHAIGTSCQKVNSMTAEGSRMVWLKNSMRTASFHVNTYPISHHNQQMMPYTYTNNFNSINVMSQELGIPWEASKDRLFTNSTICIGFNWNIKTHQVLLVSVKKEKYLRAMEDWLKWPTHTLEEAEKTLQ